MLKSFLGIGLLTFPYAYSLVGLPLAISGTVVVVFLVRLSMVLLLQVDDLIDTTAVAAPRLRTYPTIVQVSLGGAHSAAGSQCEWGRSLYWLTLVTIVLGQFGTLIGYLTFVGSNIEQLFPSLSLPYAVLVGAAVVLGPSLIPQMRALSPVAAVGILALVSALVAFFVYCGGDSASQPKVEAAAVVAREWTATHWRGLFQFVGVALFAAEGITALPSVKYSLRSRGAAATSDMSRLLDVTLAIMTVALVAFGTLGWACAGLHPPSIITHDLSLTAPTAKFIRAALAVYILCTYPLQLFPAVEALQDMMASSGASPTCWCCCACCGCDNDRGSWRHGGGKRGGGGEPAAAAALVGPGQHAAALAAAAVAGGGAGATASSGAGGGAVTVAAVLGGGSGSDGAGDAAFAAVAASSGSAETSSLPSPLAAQFVDAGLLSGAAATASSPPKFAAVSRRAGVAGAASRRAAAATDWRSTEGDGEPAYGPGLGHGHDSLGMAHAAAAAAGPAGMRGLLGDGDEGAMPWAADSRQQQRPCGERWRVWCCGSGSSYSSSTEGGAARRRRRASPTASSSSDEDEDDEGDGDGYRRLPARQQQQSLELLGSSRDGEGDGFLGREQRGGSGDGEAAALFGAEACCGYALRAAFVVLSALVASQVGSSFGATISFVGWLCFGVLSFVLPPAMYLTMMARLYGSGSGAAGESLWARRGRAALDRGDHWWAWTQRTAGLPAPRATAEFEAAARGRAVAAALETVRDAGFDVRYAAYKPILATGGGLARGGAEGEEEAKDADKGGGGGSGFCAGLYGCWLCCSCCKRRRGRTGPVVSGLGLLDLAYFLNLGGADGVEADPESQPLPWCRSIWVWERAALYLYMGGGVVMSVAGMVVVVLETVRDARARPGGALK